MRLIDLDELLKREEQAYRQVITQEAKTPDTPIVMTLIREAFVGMLADSPIVEAEPVIHAKWEISSDGYYPYCTNCHNEPTSRIMTKFCPNCGAKMDGKEDT